MIKGYDIKTLYKIRLYLNNQTIKPFSGLKQQKYKNSR